MPKRGRTKSAAIQQVFIDWLQTIGSIPYNGKSILTQYMQRNMGSDWEEMKSRLRNEKIDWWVFLRGKMSSDDVAAAKADYVANFVFICKEEPSEPYLTGLLDIEECQLKLRITESEHKVSCPECKKRDVQIRALKTQIQRMNEEVTFDARLELMREEFRRSFKHDAFGRLQRSTLRVHMEEFLKRDINDHESLPASCTLWACFLRDVVRAPPQGCLRFSMRQNSIVGALIHEETESGNCDEESADTRHRAIDGAGDAVPYRARDRHLGNYKRHRVCASASAYRLDD